MKNLYIATTYKDPGSGKVFSFVADYAMDSANLAKLPTTKFEVLTMMPCSTRQKAKEVVAAWNESAKEEGNFYYS